MNGQVRFSIRGRNPDVLTCIANLSNDEVFTPPEFANMMLDTLAEAWAASHNGANIWADMGLKFLDPCTKSGVFLREITARLTKGLQDEIPKLEDRVEHILTKQVFGIGITHLTSLLARRSLYCSKHAKGKHSIGKGFASDAGNVWFERLAHAWIGTKCRYCAAPRTIFDREEGLETHAYPFIHTSDIKTRIAELFGGNMQFDVIIGNPPYQMTGGAGGSSDSSIFQLFVEQAIRLEPRFLSMVIPSRWMAGGRGLDEFRAKLLTEQHLRSLVDYPVSKEVFPGVEIKGGICYFLWDHTYQGQCNVRQVRDGQESNSQRDLGEFDVFIRDTRAVAILKKVLAKNEDSISELLTNREPFKLESNFRDFHPTAQKGDVPLYYIDKGKRGLGYIKRGVIRKNVELIDTWKVLVPKAGSDGGQRIPDAVLGKPLIADAPSTCTGSYLFFSASSKDVAESIQSYYTTKFFRFLVSLRKITQDAFRPMYVWVPLQAWDRVWTDQALYKKYGLTQDQVDHIESVIKPMELDKDDE